MLSDSAKLSDAMRLGSFCSLRLCSRLVSSTMTGGLDRIPRKSIAETTVIGGPRISDLGGFGLAETLESWILAANKLLRGRPDEAALGDSSQESDSFTSF